MVDEALPALRELLAQNNIGYYLVLTQDAHDSEYVANTDKRRAYISGFNGSAGTAVIGRSNYAELSTDGRYFIAASQQLSKNWTLRKEGMQGVMPWHLAVAARARDEGVDIGVDPALIPYSVAETIINALRGSSSQLKPLKSNLIDRVWPDKPSEPNEPVVALAECYSGQSFGSKLAELRQAMVKKMADAIVISALDEVAWLLNARGNDIEYNPVFKSFVIVTASQTFVYIDDSRVSPGAIPDVVKIKPYADIYQDIENLAAQKQRLWVPSGASWALVLAASGKTGIEKLDMAPSPICSAKAVKNPVEIDGARRAQQKCGVAIVQYLTWLQEELSAGRELSEYSGARKLHELRCRLPDFRGESFETISSSGPNAAIIHYAPSATSSAPILRDQIYLLDSGCQFWHGTTDTTRTVHFGTPTAQEREAYTLVLKGHIGLAVSVFPRGIYGYQLDPIARKYLWEAGLDYRHGTGHGVGSYLNVHEGPIGIHRNASLAMNAGLEEGNLLSNEPGFYEEGKFGVRIENLVVVKRATTKYKTSGTTYLGFETITLVPFDRNLIDLSLLTAEEISWINSYHKQVRMALWDDLNAKEQKWLSYHTDSLP